MLFSSIPFLYYFLPITLILYYAVPKSVKNVVLLLASLVFYGWGEPSYVFIMIGSIIVGYVTGILLEKIQKTTLKKVVLIVSLVISLGLLAYFKYANFFIENFILKLKHDKSYDSKSYNDQNNDDCRSI